MRKTLSLYLLIAIAMLGVSSCTVVRDTTPCNNALYLRLSERTDLTLDEKRALDSLDQRCQEYTVLHKDDPPPAEPEGAGWLGVGLGVAAALIVLYFTGVII